MQEQVNALWDRCLSSLSKRVNKPSFFTWFKPTRVEFVEGNCFSILVPNNFAAHWISERYSHTISESLAEVSEQPWNFDFKVQKMPVQVEIFSTDTEEDRSTPVLNGNGNGNGHQEHPAPKLNPRYLFESFVVGDSNQFAYAACEAVSEAPGENRYNPLFIYGGVGLGKTHLVQAIGNAVCQSNNKLRVMYVSSESFTNEFIRSLSTKSVHEFANRYRTADLLLLDDIQFFTGKESTQEQFFHTFNALHQEGKQIVLTADRPPKDILGLEERLLSRFSWGLVADIQPPSLETRVAILQKKAESDGVTVPNDVLTYIADSITSNVRELEGALVRLVAYASLRKKELTMSLAQDVLKDSIRSKSKPVTIEQIQKEVASYFKISEEMLKSKKKTQEIVNARQVAMYLCRTLTSSSLKLIGINFGNRDHSTVIHACQQVQDNMKSSMDFKLQIDQLINLICSHQ
ncbi:MAG: chromosomal replication initiator protein DnaA [bacterium]|nr:chromosomal replication initiator protein DnaA [bacterium]